MQPEIVDKRAILSALIGAGLCLFFLRSGILAFFFLVPLGFIAYRYNYQIAWAASLCAILGNAVLTLGTAVSQGFPVADTVWNLLYFTVMASIFTWITTPPPSGLFGKLTGVTRLMAGSCLGALLFTGIFFRITSSPAFSEYLGYLMNTLLSIYRSSGSDVVQTASMEMLTPEAVLEGIKAVLLRGGSLVSCVFLFSVCRQLSLLLVRLVPRKGAAGSPGTSTGGEPADRRFTPSTAGFLACFHVQPVIIWIFSSSLLLVVLTRITKLEIPEIILWNILVLCAILYFAQGLGIMQFFLARMPPFPRLALSVLFVLFLFSPFVNAVLLGGIVLLGTAENWAPFRTPKQNGPPSTPEDG